MTTLSIQYFHGSAGLVELEERWQQLINELERPNFSQCPDWYGTHLDAAEEPQAIIFAAVFGSDNTAGNHADAGQLLAVLPFVALPEHKNSKWPSSMTQRCALPYGTDIFSADIVFAKDADPAQVWQFICKQMRNGPHAWQIFQAIDMHPGKHGFVELLTNTLPPTSWVHSKTTAHCKFIKLKPHAEMIAGLTKKFRYRLRRSERELSELGNCTFEWNEGSDAPAAMDEFIKLELRSWKGNPDAQKDGYPAPAAIGLEAAKERLHRRTVERFASKGMARVLLVRLDGEVIGAQFSLVVGRTETIMKTAIKEGMGNAISLGHTMIEQLIRKIDEDNQRNAVQVDEFNLISDYEWPESWRPERRPYHNFRIYNKSIFGAYSAMRQRLAG